MRGLLAGMAGIFILLVLGGLALGVRTFGAVKHERQTASAYVDEVVPAITANWDATALTARADPALLQQTDEGKLKLLFIQLSTLGPLQTYQGASLQATSVQAWSGRTTLTTERFVASAHYTHGDARIDLLLVSHDDGWRILGFHVNSDALSPQAVPERL